MRPPCTINAGVTTSPGYSSGRVGSGANVTGGVTRGPRHGLLDLTINCMTGTTTVPFVS
jgi:hypothetical protein